MNLISRTKIEYCLNPDGSRGYFWSGGVYGCKTGCKFNCWARNLARRFAYETALREVKDEWDDEMVRVIAESLKNFYPTWLEHLHKKDFPKKPSSILVGFMSDIYWWRREWMDRVIRKCSRYPQHRFYFLTKFPRVYIDYRFPLNCWLGVTSTGGGKNLDDFNDVIVPNKKWISFEPLFHQVDVSSIPVDVDWIVVGFQTNPFMKIEQKAVTDIIEYTRKNKIPLFLKDSVWKGYPDLPIIKEFSKEER